MSAGFERSGRVGPGPPFADQYRSRRANARPTRHGVTPTTFLRFQRLRNAIHDSIGLYTDAMSNAANPQGRSLNRASLGSNGHNPYEQRDRAHRGSDAPNTVFARYRAHVCGHRILIHPAIGA